ncbi:MAG TPA: AAA family ATPase [Mucilaginibacter sp.]|jgi:predicted ATPase|nr:AAA family ATPase [Mucilaginibacter sp.]
MLTNINIKHYKAFEDVSIPIRPITILLGANSVGKSSIIQLLLMLQQTGKAGFKSYKSALKLYGGYVNLGDPKNLFRKKDITKPIKIAFDVRSKTLKDFLKSDFFDSFISVFSNIPIYLPLKGFSEIRHKPINNSNEFSLYIDSIAEVLSKDSTMDTYKRDITWFLRQRYEVFIPQINQKNKAQFIVVYEFLEDLSKNIKNENFRISYELKLNNENNLEIESFEIAHERLTILSFKNKEFISIASDLLKIDEEDVYQIIDLFEPQNTIFNSFSNYDSLDSNEGSIKVSVIVQIFNFFQNELKKEFSEDTINYVSPLRAHPKRYYMLDKAKLNLTLDTLDGDAIAEVLKDNESVTKNVNSWLKRFGVEVNVQEFKEVIHHLVVKQNNLTLDITDVGFGISQILPVIIQGFLSSKNSTTIIEQPEIHLHPKMQADLADLFIDIVRNSTGKKLIIETHSEYLLKRLRRRISENKISSNNVSICLIDPQTTAKGAHINNLKIEEKGFFEWPIDFYGGELLKDTTEFLKNQSN